MYQYNWQSCPIPVRARIQTLCEQVSAALGDTLIGIYLHGSLALGCFNPERSDLDLLVVNAQPMSVETKRHIVGLLLQISKRPGPLEISFLVLPDLRPFRHPSPFDLHYSEIWRQKVGEDLANGTWRRWNEETRHDADLAVHVTIARQRGITLFGKPASEVLPPVPHKDYLSSLISDYQDARTTRTQNPVYFVLNACRTHAYISNQHIFSKDEGGVYGLKALPISFHPLITQALATYRGQPASEPFTEDDLTRFAAFIDQQIL